MNLIQEVYTLPIRSNVSFDVAEKIILKLSAIGNFTTTGIDLGIMGGLAGGVRSMVAGITM